MHNGGQVVSEDECVRFLQWALPFLHLRWKGFRRVRGQVCKRLKKRLATLGISSLEEYRHYLHGSPHEWHTLDQLCRITITRFYRDRAVFRFLAQEVLPTLLAHQSDHEHPVLRVWSAGCASGEEPYTVKLVWHYELAALYPQVALQIVATDIDAALLERARAACYAFSAVKNLPESWRQEAFVKTNEGYCLRESYKQGIHFTAHDIRGALQAEPFQIILCRNLAFTYYDAGLQQQVLDSLCRILQPNGVLVLGVHESFVDQHDRFFVVSPKLGIFRKKEEGA